MLWRDYRSLVGLLEHIRHAVHARRLRMYGLYGPHRLLGKRSALEPESPIKPSPHLSASAVSWIDALLHRPGAWCSESFPRVTFSASPACTPDLGRSFFCYTDAALEGAPIPSFGGWFHGFYFLYRIPDSLLGYPIPQLEFLATVCAVIVFRALIGRARAMLVTDSETSFNVLDHDGAHSEEMQFIHVEFERAKSTSSPSGSTCFDGVRHSYGEANPFADLASRGRLAELLALCRQHGFAPVVRTVPADFDDVLARFLTRFGARYASPSSRSSAAGKNSVLLGAKCAVADKDGHKGRPPHPLAGRPVPAYLRSTPPLPPS